MNTATATQRELTLEQEQLVRDFVKHYELDPDQISFDSDRGTPVFDYDALSVLSLALAPDIISMIAERGNVDHIAGIADATCVVTLRDNRSRTVYGTALVGEQMPGGNQIGDIKQALDIAQARAARRGLRAVGFDPVRAHEKRMRGEEVVLDLSEPKDLRQCDLATIHLLKRECGYNTGTGDDQDYRALIRQLFPDLQEPSAAHMDEQQRVYFITTLRALHNSRQRTMRTTTGAAHSALRANAHAATAQE